MGTGTGTAPTPPATEDTPPSATSPTSSAAAPASAAAPPPPAAPATPEKPIPMTKAVRIAFGFYMMSLNILLVYVLINIWPDGVAPDGVTAARDVSVLSFFHGALQLPLSLEKQYLLIVIVCGALGSYIHTATSFADFVGNRVIFSSWTWWYLLRPFIGIALALLVYFVVRGGLIATSNAASGASALSPFGLAAITGMAGMFSKQATDKLREVFENLFKTDRPTDRADKIPTEDSHSSAS